MSPRHVYNAEGVWVAFIVEDQVFDRAGDLIGKLVDNREVYTKEGSRLGTLGANGRLFL